MVDVAQYMIHTPPMRLIDDVASCDIDGLTLTALATVRADAPYWDGQAVKSWWYVELIAQATGILFNYGQGHTTPKMGFLLAIGDFRCHSQDVQLGDTLRIETTNKFRIEDFYVQQGKVLVGDKLVAAGDLKCLSNTDTLINPESSHDHSLAKGSP